MSLVQTILVAMEIWACMVGLIVILYTGKYVYQNSTIKELWLELILTNLLLVCDACTYVFGMTRQEDSAWLLPVTTFVVYFLHCAINWRYAVNVNRMIHPSNLITWNGYTIASAICLGVCVIALCSNPWTEIYYHFTEEGEYIRGPFVFLSFLFPLLSIVICGMNIARHFHGFPRRIGRTFILSLVIIIVSMAAQFFIEGYALINLAINIDIILLLLETGINIRERQLRKQEAVCSYYNVEDDGEEDI